MRRPLVRQFFIRISVLWASVLMLNAGLVLWLLVSSPLRSFVLERSAVTYGLTAIAIFFSITGFMAMMRRDGITVEWAHEDAFSRPSAMKGPTQAFLRRLTQLTRPLAMRSAGTDKSRTSVVRHVGRRSGRTNETPVVAVEHDEGFFIALPYGDRTDWMKKRGRRRRHPLLNQGRTYRVDQPQVVPMAEATGYFGPKEKLHRRFRGRHLSPGSSHSGVAVRRSDPPVGVMGVALRPCTRAVHPRRTSLSPNWSMGGRHGHGRPSDPTHLNFGGPGPSQTGPGRPHWSHD